MAKNSKPKESKRKVREKLKNADLRSKKRTFLIPKTKCGCCMCISLIIIIVGLVVTLTIYSSYLSFIAKQSRNVSDILRDIVQYANELEVLELQYKKVLMTDPFQELVEKQVMPVHDKISSIKRQIKIYEDMDRMPGGPKSFMETTFKDINYIEYKIHDFERQYGLILVSMKKELENLSAESRGIYTRLMGVIEENTIEKLKEKGIYMDEAQFKFKQNPPKTFEEVIDLILQLANLYAQWEDTKAELYSLIKEHNITELEQTYGTPAFTLFEEMRTRQKQIDQFLEENDKYIRMTFMFFEKQLEGFRRDEEGIVSIQTKFKMRYDRLTEMLTDDIFNARQRVKNLRYSSSKKSEL